MTIALLVSGVVFTYFAIAGFCYWFFESVLGWAYDNAGIGSVFWPLVLPWAIGLGVPSALQKRRRKRLQEERDRLWEAERILRENNLTFE